MVDTAPNYGSRELLAGKQRLGFYCSIRCSGDLILKSYDFAQLVSRSGLTIISGFQSAIEKDCLSILLSGSAPIIIVQGRRLSTARLPAEWQKAIEPDACCSSLRL